MRTRAYTSLAPLVAVIVLIAWAVLPGHRGRTPPGDYAAPNDDSLRLTGSDAEPRRRAVLARAALRPGDPFAQDQATALPREDNLACRFEAEAPSGTSDKFDCVFDGGVRVKVKYGRNPELHAEAAATRLLRALGYAADRVDIVPRLRCYGCPHLPFATMELLSLAASTRMMPPHGYDDAYTDFEWVSIEHRFPAPEIETTATKGWSWWELDRVQAPRVEIDALKLLAVFLAHWDNKSSNQRLVCLDAVRPADASSCQKPLAMVQDLGATFGPTKVNLGRWRALPFWEDRRTCTVSMALLPWGGATFGRFRISEAGRQLFVQRLAGVSDADLRRIFVEAQFPRYQAGTSDERDLAAWMEAFRSKQSQVSSAQCPMTSAD